MTSTNQAAIPTSRLRAMWDTLWREQHHLSKRFSSLSAAGIVVGVVVSLLSFFATIDEPTILGGTICGGAVLATWLLISHYGVPATLLQRQDEGLLWYVPRTPMGMLWRMGSYAVFVGFFWHLFTSIPYQTPAPDSDDALLALASAGFLVMLATYLPTELSAYFVARRWSRTPPPAVFLGWLVVSWIVGMSGGTMVAGDLADTDAYLKLGFPSDLLHLIPTPTMFLVLVGGWLRYIPVSRYQREMAAQKERAAQAEQGRQLAEAQLSVLQAQIEPHFLYNTLASVRFLVGHDAQRADYLLEQLILYLRHAMPKLRQPMSTLRQEFQLTDAYTRIIAVRMGGRLTVKSELQAGMEEVVFPPLVLQTLVENAIKHGLEPKVGPVHLGINASRRGDDVVLQVTDDGVGLVQGAKTAGSGAGLANIRERLAGIYGDRARLSVMDREPGGVEATVTIHMPADNEPSTTQKT